MTNIHDQRQRDRALDPSHSFIVQAPAGSGKTELLTQRFLVLLSQVKQPEEILAITFTKKSAAEMRARIINALKKAHNDPEPESEHGKKTWNLAKAALARNHALKWNLLDNPNRLRIQTIDSFNASLTRQLPILSHFGAPFEISDNTEILYRTAVQEFLSHLEEEVPWADAIAQLLTHMDNDLNKVETLLINLLAKRDQWLPYITFNASDSDLRKNLESNLQTITTDILAALDEQFPKEHKALLTSLILYAAHNVKNDSPIACCIDLLHFPDHTLESKNFWLAIANLLIKKDFDWRKRFDISVGFLPTSQIKNPEEKAQLQHLQQQMKNLSEQLQAHENLRLLFAELQQAPDSTYQSMQWETLKALHEVLRIAVAQLKIIFQQKNKIDYIENAQAALLALGNEENIEEIALALDYKIQHILIDEFQDTSNSQYRLLTKLIAGWEKNDGRTLFIVGDPMQSIYRFREAEVGLFIRARKMGIQHIALEPLTLTVNFRSTQGIVDWVNEHFQKVFPAFEDISSGAVPYSASIANQTIVSEEKSVLLHPFENAEETAQANTILNIIRTAKTKNPQGKIAILVRSRTHLEDIIPALKKANIPFRAIDIDPLTARPIIQDLMALTKALLNPTDRISWLALLRAPWCGFSLSDLLIIAGKNPEKTIWEKLSNPQVFNELSQTGQLRLQFVLSILQQKIAERRRHSLRLFIESTWLMLGGPACAKFASDLEDASSYFKLLEKLDESFDLPFDIELDHQVQKLFAAPNNQADHSLQIMTIHNAKGLEFDTVILPHLERKSPNDDKQLLLWMERSRQNSKSELILAPVHAIGNENDSIYDYIKRQNAIKSDFEAARLLYVAITRAKSELHLLFNTDRLEKSSLLNKLWPTIQTEVSKTIREEKLNVEQITQPRAENKIYRLTEHWIQPLHEIDTHAAPAYQQKNAGTVLPDKTPQLIGTLVHQILQQISLNSISWWSEKSAADKIQYVKNNLKQRGIFADHLSDAVKQVSTAIENTLTDAKGQWILHPHPEAKSEFALTHRTDAGLKQFIIDRTFVDETGTRWIIDYKTTNINLDESIEDFLKREQKEHLAQLKDYFQAMKALDHRPIKMGLYFPLLSQWAELP